MPYPQIVYDPSKSKETGFVSVQPDGDPKLEDRDRKRLLNLLFSLVYTREGRQLLLDHRPPMPDDEVRTNLRDILSTKYGIIEDALLAALIEGHLAGVKWVEANARMPDERAAVEREFWQKVYQQNMAVVTWALWEDAMGPEFSILW